MSTNASTSHTMSRHTAGLTNDHEMRNPQGGIYTPEFASFNPSQPGDSFISAAVLPHHQVQTHIGFTYPVVPRIPEYPAQYPWHGGSGYNTPTDLEHWDFVTRRQPGIVPQDDSHQAGTLQENVPWNSFVIPAAVASSTRTADSQIEGYADRPVIQSNPCGPFGRQSSRDTNLRCGWTDCTARSTFNRWEDLSRHIKTIHVFPASYVCRFCDRTFNRKDNLVEHQLRTHRSQ
ncbi:uncharacterized protein BO88DRAFT_405888 [Aspergillus vadensis CBS 113365]|uniref:C2H2-type domain-containing protein n=1 Tax=Aspergillus vadensis (strain CBS 113365 / IMI 142717 / IBT 24658) TaxID=1448311 RepID=A0A319CI64_ASPVC|nr:hypothetical protein BO88DRAFT_405888 [Aspergillus vadensis CBS 113365]PYH67942.1 hypothetical protein BO88DRAFT_405888 [Aspergillus vadensis CBS 113365]